jgi:tetratricopeptide (TPR) repeat protein
MNRLMRCRRVVYATVVAGLVHLGGSVELGAQSPAGATASADQPMLRELLRARSFGRLESLLASYADSMRADIAKEPLFLNSFTAFQIPDPALRAQLDAWVAATGSAYAYTARAAYFVGMGFESRGTNYARKTSRSQFDGMRRAFEQAVADITAALERDSTAVAAYWLLQSVAQTSGNQAMNRRIVDRALTFAPASLLLRARHMRTLTPRWGGSHEAMRQFAEESQRFVGANPQLVVLRGFVAADEGYSLAVAGDREGALRKFTEALSHGEYWDFRVERAHALYALDREEEALRDYNLVLRQRPQLAEALAGRALAYWYISDKVPAHLAGEYERRARADLERAIQIDPSDYYVRQAVRNHPELRARTAR